LFHTLVGTFVDDQEQLEPVLNEEETYYPLKVIMPSQKTLSLHFRSQEEAAKWA
jgi:hypothetical protein